MSIFLDAPQATGSDKDLIGIYGTELATCEKLMTMGYNSSNNVNLAKRAEELEKAIVRLEDRIRAHR